MTCAVCGAPAPIATHYTLPTIYRAASGGYANRVACSLTCRDQWHAERAAQDAEVQALQQSDQARAATAREQGLIARTLPPQA